jgi:hypothetical protein
MDRSLRTTHGNYPGGVAGESERQRIVTKGSRTTTVTKIRGTRLERVFVTFGDFVLFVSRR